MVQASTPVSIRRLRYSAERHDRKFLRETSAPFPRARELSTYRKQRILDRESEVLASPSVERVTVPAHHLNPCCGRLWEHPYHLQPIHHTVLESLNASLP